jgi:hypothetical protein
VGSDERPPWNRTKTGLSDVEDLFVCFDQMFNVRQSSLRDVPAAAVK